MTAQPSDDEKAIRPFSDFLRDQNRGRTHDELSEGLNDLVARVKDTGKKGTVTLIVSVEPMKGNEDALLVHDEIKLKLPEHDRGSSIFFADKEHNLRRDDPNQPAFEFLTEVPAPAGLNPETGEIPMTGKAN